MITVNVSNLSAVHYPVYSGSVPGFTNPNYKVGQATPQMPGTPNIVTLSNSDGDTLNLSAAAQAALGNKMNP